MYVLYIVCRVYILYIYHVEVNNCVKSDIIDKIIDNKLIQVEREIY